MDREKNMIIERVKSSIVAQLSYFIGSQTEAMVVDPRRDGQIYVDLARREHMNIQYVFETHRNEDYVIGSRELAARTGAEIYHGPWPDFTYGHTLRDGQEFAVGRLRVTAIHTPGHTPGCVSYAVADLDSGEDTVLVCTGDTLFVNDVGRTDFGGPAKRRAWSEALYASIVHKLLPLGDHVILLPAHGAGSVCGGNIADREWSTLGLERRMNPLLQMSKEDFIAYKVTEHHEYAPYFRQMEQYNREGAPFVEGRPTPTALTPDQLQRRLDAGALLVDTRAPTAFGGAHISGAYNIPASRLSIAGWLLPYDQPILLLTEDTADLEYATQSLIHIGYDNVEGYLAQGLSAWFKAGYPLESSGLLTAQALKDRLDAGEALTLLDVRSRDEWAAGHIPGVQHIYLGLLEPRLDEVPSGLPIVVICKTGTRASAGASILLRRGRRDVYNLLGGMDAWKKRNYAITT